jgi:nucleoside-diphosphate-sugar epimerase
MLKKNRVVVFGSKGFIGNDIIKYLRKKKYHIVPISRDLIDFEKRNSIFKTLKILKKNDIIIFAIARAPCKTHRIFIKNLKISLNLCEILKKFKSFRQLIYISSDAVYKDSMKKINEKSLVLPDSLHGLMHYSREIMLNNIINKKLCIIRPTLVYGKNDPHNGYGPNQFCKLMKKNKDINIFGKGEELRDHIYISDLSKLIYQCLINNYVGVINAVTGTAVSFYEIAKFFKNKNNKIKIINIPRTQKMPHNGFRLFDNKKIKKLFYNFHFTKIKVGLNRIS